MAFDYVMTARELSGSQFIAEPGPIRFLKIPAGQQGYDKAHVIGSPAEWAAEVRAEADGAPNPRSISPTGDVLIFVHGYNNDIPLVLDRLRVLKKNLKAEGWRGTVIAFDWPSDNQTLNYLEDRSDGADVARELVRKGIKLLAEGQANGCATNIHLLCHSAGAYVTMEAFAQAEKTGDIFKSDWRIGQVAFVAADVSSASLSASSEWARPMYRRIMRLTNYSSGYDSVLGISNAKRLGIAPRAGRVGIPLDADPKSTNIDCTDYFNKLDAGEQTTSLSYTHSWYIDDRVFARDLAMALEGAIDRHAIPTRKSEGGKLVLVKGQRPNFQKNWNAKLDIDRQSRRI